MARNTVTFQSVYSVAELLTHILAFTSWDVLVNLSQINCALRAQACYIFRHNISCILSKFIPSEHHRRFWDLLGSTNAIIIGAIVRCMMDITFPYHLRSVHPQRLDIIVPHSHGSVSNLTRWTNVLNNIGYEINQLSRSVGLPSRFKIHSSYFFVFDAVRCTNSQS